METIPINVHLSSESLEEYVMGRLPAKEAARLSEHLFECDSCYQRYEQECQLLVDLRAAGHPPPAVLEEEKSAVLPFWSRITGTPGPLLAGASAVVLVTLLVPRLTESPGSVSPAVAELTAYRSAGAATSAPANRNLVLRLDTTGLESVQQGGQFRAEVADRTGAQVWSGKAVQKEGGRWELMVDKRLAAGQYWVRLYSPVSVSVPGSGEPELLREFSLQLQ